MHKVKRYTLLASSIELIQFINDPDVGIRREVARRVIQGALSQLAYDEDNEVRRIVAGRVKTQLTPVIHQIMSHQVEEWNFKETEFLPQLFILTNSELTHVKRAALLGRMPASKFRVMISNHYWRDRLNLVPYLPVSHIIEMTKDSISNVRIEAIGRVPPEHLTVLLDTETDELVIDFILERMEPDRVPEKLRARYEELVVEQVIES